MWVLALLFLISSNLLAGQPDAIYLSWRMILALR